MNTEEQDIYPDRIHFSGRIRSAERTSKGRTGGDFDLFDSISTILFKASYNSDSGSFLKRKEEVENGGRKWNFAQKKGENVKNGLRNPLIFREIPRNYGVGRIIYFVGHGKSDHLTFKKGLPAAAIRGIRTSQVVDFWRNLAYSHKKMGGGAEYTMDDLRYTSASVGLVVGDSLWYPHRRGKGGVNGLGGFANGSS